MRFRYLLSLIVGLCAMPASAAPRVEVHALMKDAAILRIDQQQHLLRAGQRSPEGVLLVSASTRAAIVDVEGRRSTLSLSNRIAATFAEPEVSEVQIRRNERLQYITSASINDRRALVLVDTGANSVAMSSTDASRLGIDYRRRGVPVTVRTASEVVPGYRVVIDKIALGGITANFVEATVTEGEFPAQILLGTTFLRHVEMREENGIMYLRQK